MRSRDEPQGKKEAAILDESTGEWIPFELNLDDPEELASFLRGELPKKHRGLDECGSAGAHAAGDDRDPSRPARSQPGRPAAHRASDGRPARVDG